MNERHRFSTVGKVVRVSALHAHAGIFARESRRIADQNDELARRDKRPDGESVTDPVRETHAAEFEICAGDVFQLDELDHVAIVIRRAGRVIHDLGDEQAGEILNNVKRGFRHRAPDPTAEHARPDKRALSERDRRSVNQRARRQRAAGQTRVRAVARVINCSRWRAHGQLEAVRHVAAKLIEGRSGNVRIQPVRFELIQHDAGPLRQVAVRDAIDLGNPFHIACQRRFALRVAPAG